MTDSTKGWPSEMAQWLNLLSLDCECHSFSRLDFHVTVLKVGVHKYDNEGKIEVIPVPTILRGLCYKIKFSKPLLYNPDWTSYRQLIVSSSVKGVDELKNIDILIASENTWQGKEYTVKL